MPKTEFHQATASPKELLKRGVVSERYEELTQLGCIETEEDLIDQHRLKVLKKSMLGRRGQIAPVTLRARLNENNMVVYDIIDGFHRTPAVVVINEDTGKPRPLKAIVLYGGTDEEMYDLRVIAADNVKSIKFPRMAKWMNASFRSREWQNNRISGLITAGDLTLSQVFSLAAQDTSGKKLGLTPQETEELKEWAFDKAEIWGKPIASLLNDMRTVDLSAPDLVQRVRLGTGARGDRGVLTQARLQAIAENLPGEWELQRQFVELALERNIVATDLDFLTFAYKTYREAGDEKSMNEILSHPETLLRPRSPARGESHTIFDARAMPEAKGEPLPVRVPAERIRHRVPAPANSEKASSGAGMLFLAMLEQRAFALPLTDGEPRTVFNLTNHTIDNGTKKVTLTTTETKMLFVLLALKDRTQKRISTRILDRVLSPTSSQDNDWMKVFNSLKAKLKKLSPHLPDNLKVVYTNGPLDYFIWDETVEKPSK